jgi:hypothetical protein
MTNTAAQPSSFSGGPQTRAVAHLRRSANRR